MIYCVNNTSWTFKRFLLMYSNKFTTENWDDNNNKKSVDMFYVGAHQLYDKLCGIYINLFSYFRYSKCI